MSRLSLRRPKKFSLGRKILWLLVVFFSSAIIANGASYNAIGNGTFYIYNVGAKKWVNFGGDTGYKMILADHPSPITISTYTSSAGDTYAHLFADNYEKGHIDLVMTANHATTTYAFCVDRVADAIYSIHPRNESVYLGYSGETSSLPSHNLVVKTATSASTENEQWQFFTREQLLSKLDEATEDSPEDATFMISCPEFNFNDLTMAKWQGISNTATNLINSNWSNATNYYSTYYYNMCGYMFSSKGDVNQTVTGLPAGRYKVKMQGFYRPASNTSTKSYVGREGNAPRRAVLYANEEQTQLVSILSHYEGSNIYSGNGGTGAETTSGFIPYLNNNASNGNRYSDAGIAFDYGLYNNEVDVNVGPAGTLILGVKDENLVNDAWTAFDNFELFYYGKSNEAIHTLGTPAISRPEGNCLDRDAATPIEISFPNRVSTDDEQVTLVDGAHLEIPDGAIASMNNETLTISGLPTTVGSSFTITIPAGAIGYQTSGVTNEAMTLSYTIVEPVLAEDFTGYVYAIVGGEKKFLSRGSNNSARLIYDDYGVALQVAATDGNGGTKIKCIDSQLYLYSYEDAIVYTDVAEGDARTAFQLVKVADGQYKIKANNSTANGYLGPKPNASGDAYKLYENYAENDALVWHMMSKADYDALVAARVASYKTSALTAASLTEADLEDYVGQTVKTTTDTETASVRENFVSSSTGAGSRDFSKQWSYSGLEEGLYLVSIKAFNRNGTNANVFAGYQYDNPMTFLNVNGQKQPLCSVLDGKSTTELLNSDRYHDYGTIDGQHHYTPNGMTGAAAWFDAGYYNNSMYVYVSDGTLNISLTRDSYVDQCWTCYRDLTVQKMIPATVEDGDITHLLRNADFSNGLTGWTYESTIGDAASTVDTWVAYAPNAASVTKTPHVVQTYSGWSELTLDKFSIKQSVKLPAGTYRLRGYAFLSSSSVTAAQMFAGSNEVEVCHRSAFSDKVNCVPFDVPGNLHEASEAFHAGNYLNELIFTLTEEQTIELGFKGTHNKKQGWFCNGPVTLEKINDDILAEEAAAEVDDLKTLYASRKTAYTAIAAQHTKSGLTFNTDQADAKCEAATTKADAVAAIQSLDLALNNYMDFFDANETFDMTSLIVNPGFETATPIGWWHATEGGDVATHSIGTPGSTYYVDGFEGNRLFNTWFESDAKGYSHYLLQRIEYLPKGDYSLAAKFASNQSTDDSHMRIFANAFESDYVEFSGKETAVDASVRFTMKEPGRVRIGAKSNRWFKADDFTLTYIPKGIALPEDWMAVDLGTINLENDDVEAYLDAADYSGENPVTILNGAKNSDGPRPVVVPLPASATGEVKVYVTSTEGNYTNALVTTAETGSRVCDIVNLIPGTSYYYKVENGEGNVVSKGAFETTGRVRVLKVEGVHNVRDLGGHTNSKGQTIQYGMIFRGGEMNGGFKATDKGKQTLRDLGVLAELDLRSWNNDNRGDLHNASALDSIGGLNVEPKIVYFASNQWDSGSDSMKDANRSKWSADLDFVMDNVLADRPVYFHCRIGADRTGIVGLLIDGLLGLDQDILLKNYELTSFSGANATETLYRPIDQIINKLGVVKACTGETLQEKFEDYFINTLGLDAFKVARFQTKMLNLAEPTLAGAWNEPSTVAHFTGTADPGWKYDEIGVHTHGTYKYNTTSTEQDTDGSGLGSPFFEDWTADDYTLGNATLTKTLSGLPEGYYDISARVRVYDLNSGDAAYNAEAGVQGLSMIANDASVAITTGKQITKGGFSGKGFFGDYHVVGHVAADGQLKLGFKLDGADFSWLSFSNVKVQYIGENDQNTHSEAGVTTFCGNATFDAETAITEETRVLDITRLAQHNAMTVAAAVSPNVLIKANVGQVANAQNVIVDGTCQNLVLTDKKAFATDEEFTAVTATYSRTMPVGTKWGTICLPYEPDTDGNITYYTIASCDGSVLNLASAMPEAGKPYIYCCESEDESTPATASMSANDVTVMMSGTPDQSADYNLVGTFDNLTLRSDNMGDGVSELYYIKSNKFWAINKGDDVNPGTVSIPAFRAYVTCKASNPVRELRILLDGEEATGIEREQILNALSEDVVYNISGQRLVKPQRGINIINGKKVLK